MRRPAERISFARHDVLLCGAIILNTSHDTSFGSWSGMNAEHRETLVDRVVLLLRRALRWRPHVNGMIRRIAAEQNTPGPEDSTYGRPCGWFLHRSAGRPTRTNERHCYCSSGPYVIAHVLCSGRPFRELRCERSAAGFQKAGGMTISARVLFCALQCQRLIRD